MEQVAEPSLDLIQRMLQTVIDDLRLIRADVHELKVSAGAILDLMGGQTRRLERIGDRLARIEKRLEPAS
jgi:hypothetical protein